VTKIEPGEGYVRARCIIESGYDLLELPLPCVLTVASDEALTPRIAPLPGIIKAKKRKIPVWSASDLEADTEAFGAPGAKTILQELALPEFEGVCEFITAEALDQAAVMLADRLRSEKIL
jgi:electron transfer flavoprotein beta subunit